MQVFAHANETVELEAKSRGRLIQHCWSRLSVSHDREDNQLHASCVMRTHFSFFDIGLFLGPFQNKEKGQRVKSRISALKCAVSGRHEFEIQSVATSSIAIETAPVSLQRFLGSNELPFSYNKIKVKLGKEKY